MHVSRCLSQFVITAAALALAAKLSAPIENDSIPLSAHLTIRPYRVMGREARAIRHSLRTKGPFDQKGFSRDAFTSWAIRWRWPENSGNPINPELIQVSLEAEIVLPRISRQAEQKNPGWRRYHRALVTHELKHFQFALAGSQELAAEFRDAGRSGFISIREAHRLGRQKVEQVREKDRHYDSLTDHGRSEGIRWKSTRPRID